MTAGPKALPKISIAPPKPLFLVVPESKPEARLANKTNFACEDCPALNSFDISLALPIKLFVIASPSGVFKSLLSTPTISSPKLFLSLTFLSGSSFFGKTAPRKSKPIHVSHKPPRQKDD